MKPLVVLAVDDEAPALDELAYLLDAHPDITEVLRAGDAVLVKSSRDAGLRWLGDDLAGERRDSAG